MAGGSALAIAGWIILGLNWYTCFEEEQIVIHPLLALSATSYGYPDVDRLIEASHLKAPTGAIVERRRYFIIFHDGRLWSTEDMGDRQGAALEQSDRQLRDFLCRKTGKEFEAIQFIEEATGK